MKPGWSMDVVGAGCKACFRRARKMKGKGWGNKTILGPSTGAAEIFTVGLCG